MQPVAVITSPAEGLAYINGRLAGETGPEAPITIPVTPNGTLYAELHPFSRRWRAGAYRFRFRNGELTADSGTNGCHVILWPGNICELALAPFAAYPPESDYATLDDIPIALLQGDAPMLRVGKGSVALPEGARLPESHIHVENGELFIGKIVNGQYLAMFANDLAPLNVISATEILTENNGFTAITHLNDTVGHVLRQDISITPSGALAEAAVISSSRRPQTPEYTALAAAEALLLGENDEATGYAAPEVIQKLSAIIGKYSMALPAKYAPPTPHPAIALLERIGERMARADMLYYHTIPAGDHWVIDKISINPYEKSRRN